MELTATEFKAKCLGLIDQVHEGGEPVVITKHGKVVAKLVGASTASPIRKSGKSSPALSNPISIHSNPR